jgi:hypothetical protein
MEHRIDHQIDPRTAATAVQQKLISEQENTYGTLAA